MTTEQKHRKVYVEEETWQDEGSVAIGAIGHRRAVQGVRRGRPERRDRAGSGATASSSMKVIVNGRGAELRNGAHRGIGENAGGG